MKPSLLIVEDDEATLSFLAENLSADGFSVAAATGAAEGIRQLEVRDPALVLLDLGLGQGSGLELLDRVRSADAAAGRIDPQVPVLVLTGRGGDADRLRGFERGADDYLVKPFLYGELLARVRALLRRCDGRPAHGVLRAGDLVVDPRTRSVRIDEQPVHLSAKEFALLQALAEQPDRVVPKNDLLRDVWGYVAIGRTRTVDAHACRLRKKLAAHSPRPWIVNVRGVGYRLGDLP